jgi:hypothetical protein
VSLRQCSRARGSVSLAAQSLARVCVIDCDSGSAAVIIDPPITTTLFRVPQCRDIGNDMYHEDDYSVRCDDAKFYAVTAAAVFLIVVIPVGVPCVFLVLMKRQKDSIGGVRETALGGAKLVDDDTHDDDDRYGFLIRDFRPEFWFYEIVTYSRKLLLSGFTVLMGRGTMAQTYFVTAIQVPGCQSCHCVAQNAVLQILHS